MSDPQRVLITGIDGFTGRYVERALVERGCEVYGTVIAPCDQPRHLVCDLTDYEQVRQVVDRVQPDAVVHLAAISFVAHDDLRQMYDVNVLGSYHLFEALCRVPRPPARVIAASSATVYGRQAGILDETAMPRPVNDYGISKFSMECLAPRYADRFPVLLTRPFNYTGVGQPDHFVIPKIVSHFRRRASVVELGNVDVTREFNDVRLVAEVYTRLLCNPDARGVVNICTGRGVTLRQAIAALERLAGYSIEIAVNPAFVRANEIETLLGDPQQLRSLTGTFPEYPLEQTLEWMLSAD